MKLAFVSTILPTGHFAQYITRGLASLGDTEVLIYTDKNEANRKVQGCGKIELVWSKSLAYLYQIVGQACRDRPDIIHLQHELNMYGGMLTAACFPLLLASLRILGFRLVVTVHAAVFKDQVSDDFVRLFGKNPKIIKPWFLKLFFHVLYRAVALFSHQLMVHTQLSKRILVTDYQVNPAQVTVIPCAIPEKDMAGPKPPDYFFYFGYMVRRKGLDQAIAGFKEFTQSHPDSTIKLVLAGGVIAGQEQAYREIKDVVTASGLSERILLKGFLEEDEQDVWYSGAYAVIIPAVISMGSSGPLYHANSYGKCTIASDVGHFQEDIEHLTNGILTDNRQWAAAFALAVDQPQLVAKICEQVASKARSRSPAITAGHYRRLYEALLSGQKSPRL